MGLRNFSQVKLSPELTYMTKAEQSLFKAIENDISIFRQNQCVGVKLEGEMPVQCPKYVPNNKRFCSRECYDSQEEGDGLASDGEGGEASD